MSDIIRAVIEETCRNYLDPMRPELLAEILTTVQWELSDIQQEKEAVGETIRDEIAEAIRVTRNVCLCLLHQKTIRLTAIFYLSTPDHPSLEDIINTSLYKLLKGAEARENAGDRINYWEAFAKTIVKNEVIDLLRKSIRHRERSTDAPDVPVISDEGRAAQDMEDTVDHIITDELELSVVVFDLLYQYFAGTAAQKKMQEMDSTGKRRLKVYYLRIWEGMPQNEIARLFEVDASTITRDLKRLKTLADDLFTAFDDFVRSLSDEDRQVVRLGRRLRSVQEIAELMDMSVDTIMGKVETVRCCAGLVKQLQTCLRDAGFYGGEIDGDFGPLTLKAFVKYEHRLVKHG